MSFQFPSEIKDLVKGLHDETKWKILELLVINEKLSYTQIKTQLEIGDESKGTLNYHLKELQKAGWIRNWIEDVTDLSDNQKSFYAISKFGSKVLDGIMKAMEIESYKQDELEEFWKKSTNSTQLASAFLSSLKTSGVFIVASNIGSPELQPEEAATPMIRKRYFGR
jgi:DNA-binding PadR family transcriptional regulator